MARKNNGNYTFSGKPCDIEYRLKRAAGLLEHLEACLRSIDPEALDGNSLVDLANDVPDLAERLQAIRDSAPSKRTHVRRSAEERAEAKRQKAEREAERAERRKARAIERNRKAKADREAAASIPDMPSLDAALQAVEGAVADAAE